MPSSRESITASPASPKRVQPEYAARPRVPSASALQRAGLSPERLRSPSPLEKRSPHAEGSPLPAHYPASPKPRTLYPPAPDPVLELTKRVQELTMELQQLKSSVASNGATSSTSSNDALNSLVTLLAEKEQREQARERTRESDRQEEK